MEKEIELTNIKELALYLGIDVEILLNVITGQKELRLRDLPCIVPLGVLCIVQKAIVESYTETSKSRKNGNTIKNLIDASDCLQQYMEHNYSREEMDRLSEKMRNQTNSPA